jgi:electron transport complex protein RnfD
MSSGAPNLVIATSPFLKRPVDTPQIMRHVIYALLPAVAAGLFFFGIAGILLIFACVAGCVLVEWLAKGHGPIAKSSVTDGSAVLTGLLLAMTLPPGMPLWMGFLGGAFGIAFGKFLFGGLGHNVFNPSLVGRAFLQACFPLAITTWLPQHGLERFFALPHSTLALPFLSPVADAVTAATPLAKMKFESVPTAVRDLFLGTRPGSMGETSSVMILLGGAYLAYRRFLNWRIPVGMLAGAFLVGQALHMSDAARYPDGLFHVLSGGMMLGAVFMATDPVTSPVTPLGAWVFAALCGALVVIIRLFSGLPEGVMYAILLMNGFTPLIDRWTQPRTYGTGRRRKHG